MQINQVCIQSKLTRKAIEYYEAKGLITPQILDNGYRDYSEENLCTLKEIFVLRKCGISVDDIKNILHSGNKPASLEKCKYLAEIKMQRLQAVQNCLAKLVNDYDIDREFTYFQLYDEDLFTIKERLVFAFPGNYGMFLSLHFGRFLDEVINTEDKRQAYKKILAYLDNVELYIPPQLEENLSSIFADNEQMNTDQINNANAALVSEILNDTESYLEQHQDELEAYLTFKNSDEYKNSPAGTLQRMMLDFQQQSGYEENLLANIRILSASYRAYTQKLKEANEKFLLKFPQANYLYE